jgi:hypothetical protein
MNITGLGALVLLSLVAAAPALAQQPAGIHVWRDAGCPNCHGALGEGGAGEPRGPNLRRMYQYRSFLIEMVSCGRPGTPMPAFLDAAYTQRICYGWLRPNEPPPPEVNRLRLLTAAEVAAVVEYVLDRIQGMGEISRSECVAYYGDANQPACAGLR